MEGLLKKVKENSEDQELKTKYYQSRAIYNEIAEQTGSSSPSKKAEAKAVQEATTNKRKADIITTIKKATTMDDLTQTLTQI
jgi:hypothetical protein